MTEKTFFLSRKLFNSSLLEKESLYSRLIFFLQVVSIGLILFFLPLEYPSFQYEIWFTINNFFHGPRSNFSNFGIYIYPSDILIILMSIFTFHRWKKYLFTSSSKYLILFLIFTIFSQILNHSSAWSNNKLLILFLLTALFTQLQYILSENTQKKIHLFFFFIILMVIFQCSMATVQYFTQKPTFLKLFETLRSSAGSYPMPEKKLWLLDYFFSITRNSDMIKRAYGTLTHSNVLGGFLFFSSLISYYFFYIVKRKWEEIFFGLVIFFQFFSICLTFSRAAIIAYFIGVISWFLCMIFSKGMKDKRKGMRLALWAIISIILCFILFYPQFTNRGGIVNYNSLATSSDKVRINSILIALRTIHLNPFFGVGLENSQNYFRDIAACLDIPLHTITIVHNIFLLIAVETGLLGLSFFMLFIYSILKKTFKSLNPLKTTLLCTFIGLLFISCCDFYLWRFPSGILMFFLTGGFLNALSYNHNNRF